ncbi:unknown [Ruminococcus sp. CAG:353]|nr:unknown [Ruminococcus sp. CAG:353]
MLCCHSIYHIGAFTVFFSEKHKIFSVNSFTELNRSNFQKLRNIGIAVKIFIT